MINIYMCREKAKSFREDKPRDKVLIDTAMEYSILGKLIYHGFTYKHGDPIYTVETIGM